MINIYDFDNTIFRGDSTFRFVMYAIRTKPHLALLSPVVGGAFALHWLGLKDKTWAKQVLYRMLFRRVDAPGLLEAFWLKNMPRIKRWYLNQRRETDIVISASPEFLLAPACAALGIAQLIASPVDARTGDYLGENCHGAEKVVRYRAECEMTPFHFYSDAMSDAPMAELAEAAFLVKGDRILPWPKR